MLERFRAFSAENYEKCLGCKQYPVNNGRAIAWITRQPAGCARGFAELFYASLRHVPFTEWLNGLGKMAAELIMKIDARGYTHVVLVVDGPISKSNTMTAVLLHQHLGNRITDVINNVLTDLTYVPGRETLFIHTDDCSYSGRQIAATITPYTRVVENSTYVIACPYIGQVAYEELKKLRWVKFAKNTTIFPSFRQQIEANTTNYDCPDIANKSMDVFNDELLSTFQYMETLSAIYFDHKLADAMSIFQKVLALGPVYDGAAVGSLISGCEKFAYKTDGEPADATDMIVDFDDDGVCPMAFYKTINYTLGGTPVDKTKTIMQLAQK